MATELTFRVQLGRLVPHDKRAEEWAIKRNGQLVQGKFSQPRSLDQNALLWAVAARTFKNLPTRYDDAWVDDYAMVKGLQLAFGICDDTAVPERGGGFRIVRTPSSIADMDNDQATKACDLLFKGMARLIGVDVETLLNEAKL